MKKKSEKLIQLLNEVDRDNYIQEVIGLMINKYKNEEIYNYLLKKYNFKFNQSSIIINDAIKIIYNQKELESEYSFDVNISRYEEIYFNNKNPNVDNVPAGYKRAIICEHYFTAIDSLFQEERLLGVHTKKFRLRINSLKNSKLKSNVNLNIDSITSNEQLEFFNIIKRTKPVDKLIRSITNDNPLEIDSSIHKKVDPVIDSPIKGAKETDQIGDTEKERIKTSGKTLYDIEQIMKENIQKKIKEALEKKK